MIKVYFEKGLHADLVATFIDEQMYMEHLPLLEAQAKIGGYIVTESVETEENDKLIDRMQKASFEPKQEVIEKYARKCSVTGKGMNQGYCFDEGEFYCIAPEHAEARAIELGYINYQDAYNNAVVFWTDWNPEEEEREGNEIYNENGDIIIEAK